MRFDSKMPMVEDVCRLQGLDVRTCPIVSVALVRVHLPWWQQLIHRFHVWQRNECYLQIIITMSMHRADNVIYRNKCKINSKIEKRAFLLLLWPKWGSCLGLQMSPSWTNLIPPLQLPDGIYILWWRPIIFVDIIKIVNDFCTPFLRMSRPNPGFWCV